MHQLERKVDRALRARWQNGGEAAKNKHRAAERAIHPRPLEAKFNFFLRASAHGPQAQQKLTSESHTGVEGVG